MKPSEVVGVERDATSTAQRALRDNVLRYYALLDAGDIESMVRLFDEDTVYHRPGYEPIRGRRRLEAFYRFERVIDTGAHRVYDVLVQRSHVAVTGGFAGMLKDGSAIDVEFADFFAASRDGLFTERKSYFFVPVA